MADREVLYTIRYEPDPRNAAIVAEMAKQATAAQQQIVQAEQQAQQQRAAAVQQQAAQHANAQQQAVAAEQRRLTELARMQESWNRRVAAANEKGLREAAEHQQLMTQAYHEILARVQAESARSMEQGARQAIRGIHEIARGLVILKAVDEDTAQSALKLIGTFVSLVDLGRGIFDTYRGVVTTLNAYAVSANSAAVAQTILNQAMRGGGAAGAAAGAGGAAAGAGGAAAAGSGILAGAGALGSAAAGSAAFLAAAPVAAAGGALILNRFLSNRFQDQANLAGAQQLQQLFASGDAQAQQAAFQLQGDSQARDAFAQYQQDLHHIQGRSQLSSLRRQRISTTGRANDAAGRFQDAISGPYGAAESSARQVAAAKEEVSAREKILEITRKQFDLTQERIAAEKTDAERSIAHAKSLAQTFRDIRDLEIGKVQTAEQRFGSLDPLQRANVLRTARKAATGAELSELEAKTLSGFEELGGTGDAIRRSRSARARRGGFDELARLTGADQRVAAARLASILQEDTSRATIQANAEVKVKLDADAESLGKTLGAALKKQFEELRAAMQKQIEAEARQRRGQQTVTAAVSRAALAN